MGIIMTQTLPVRIITEIFRSLIFIGYKKIRIFLNFLNTFSLHILLKYILKIKKLFKVNATKLKNHTFSFLEINLKNKLSVRRTLSIIHSLCLSTNTCECPLCARDCSKHWGSNSDLNSQKSLFSQSLHFSRENRR